MNRPPGQHGEDVKETEEWEAGKTTPAQYDGHIGGGSPEPMPADGTLDDDPTPDTKLG